MECNSSADVMNCDLCQSIYDKQEWIDHLIGVVHLRRSRRAFVDWTDEEKRKCLIFVTNFPLVKSAVDGGVGEVEEQDKAGVVTLLQKISTGGGKQLTDFVAWEEKPRLALVKFKNEQAKDVAMNKLMQLTRQGGKYFLIPGDYRHCVTTARDLSKLDHLELVQYLPDNAWTPAPPETLPTSEDDNFADASLLVLDEDIAEDVEGSAASHHVSLLDIADDSLVMEMEESSICILEEIETTRPPLSFLQQQFDVARDAITISETDYFAATAAVHALQQLCETVDPAVKVDLVRNFYLGLKTGFKNGELLMMASKTGEYSQKNFRKKLLGALRKDPRKEFTVQERGGSHVIKYSPSGVTLRLLTDKRFLAESQANRLIEYMRTFDPRFSPLLLLSRYWQQRNPSAAFRTPPSGCSDLPPFNNALDWLVIFFLSSKKIIPTPWDIQQIPHQPLIHEETGIDIGFSQDWTATGSELNPEQLQSDAFILEILELFHDFLHFIGQLASDSLVLVNPRIGKLLRRKGTRSGFVGGWDRHVYLLHPLITHWTLALPGDPRVTFEFMRRTAKQLRGFLNQDLRCEREADRSITLASALRVNWRPPTSSKRGDNRT